MSTEALLETTTLDGHIEDWETISPPTDLIFDDGEPMESNRHRLAMNVLIRSVYSILADREDYFVGGNMFIYYSSEQVKNRDFKGPDMFVALDVDGDRLRQGWVVWQEEGRYPDVIVELMSPSTASVDLTTKKDLYERTFKTANYFVYDPFDSNSLQGWHLDSNHRYLALIPNEQGRLWCEALQVWLGIWQGTLEREPAPWLRFYDAIGQVYPLPEELAQQQADIAQQQAEIACQQAELAQRQTDIAQQQAETEHQRAENERQRSERLAERLRALGEDPDQI